MNQGVSIKRINRAWATESGFEFPFVDVAWKSWGTLNEAKDNVVLICHALTGHAAADEWFSGLFDENGSFDFENQFILCVNIPGSCYGSLSAWTENPATKKPYKSSFPLLTIRDMASFHQFVLDEFEISAVEMVLGGSMGGMISLELTLMDSRIKSAIYMAMGKSHSPWAIGISQAQRMAIFADSRWNNGNYEKENPPLDGISAARAMAMITYRTPENYTQKFDRERNEKHQFQVESYLNYQGNKLAGRFDALSYFYLTKAMDSHDVSRNRGGFEEALGKISVPCLVIGISSDALYPINEQKELAVLIPNSEFAEIDSPFGHDAFLIEFEQINQHINSFKKKFKL